MTAHSVCLANHLILNRAALLHDHAVSVMELGSGTGLVGLVAHQLNPANRVCLTDCNPVVLDRLEANVILSLSPSHARTRTNPFLCADLLSLDSLSLSLSVCVCVKTSRNHQAPTNLVSQSAISTGPSRHRPRSTTRARPHSSSVPM
jgi:hypothetical protein